GIVTKIVLKLIPAVQHNVLLLVPFFKMEEAAAAVSAIFRAGIVPSALEFMERDAIDWTMKFTEVPDLNLRPEIEEHLLIEVNGNYTENLMNEDEKILTVVEQCQIKEERFADIQYKKNAWWKLRRNVAVAVKQNTVYTEEDTVVPRYELPKLL